MLMMNNCQFLGHPGNYISALSLYEMPCVCACQVLRHCGNVPVIRLAVSPLSTRRQQRYQMLPLLPQRWSPKTDHRWPLGSHHLRYMHTAGSRNFHLLILTLFFKILTHNVFLSIGYEMKLRYCENLAYWVVHQISQVRVKLNRKDFFYRRLIYSYFI